jgi:hypothetical protein
MTPVRRTRFEAAMDKRDAVNKADAAGQVADSKEVRTALIQRMHAGELTLEQVQAELARIKRDAKKNGLLTRSQAFSRG